MDQPRIRVLVVDDHPMMRKGLAATLEPESDMQVVGAAASGDEALRIFRETRPDVTLMDLKLKGHMSGIDAVIAIRHEFPGARIVIISAYKGDEDIYRAMHAGAATFLLKEALGDELVSVIREVHAGGGPIPQFVARQLANRMTQSSLTARETEVLQLMAQGMRNKEIGASLHVSETTAQGHVKNILSKLGVHDRTEAVRVAFERGIIHLD